MRNFIIIIFLNIISIPLFSQKAIEINNNHNDNYIEISGTSIELLIPNGFIESKNFTGFSEVLTGATIMVAEVKSEVYKNFLSLDRGELFNKGIVVNANTFFLINDFDALLVEGVQQTKESGIYYKFILMIGDIFKTTIITIQIPNFNDKKTLKKYQDILTSVIFHPEKIFDVNKEYKFSIDTTGSNFKLSNSVTNTLTYTEDGEIPTKSKNHTTFSIRTTNLKQELSEQDQEKFTKEIYQTIPSGFKNIPEVKKIKINGLNAYQMSIIEFSEKMMKNQLIFLTVIFHDSDCYIITAYTLGNFEKNLEIFKKIVNSFKI